MTTRQLPATGSAHSVPASPPEVRRHPPRPARKFARLMDRTLPPNFSRARTDTSRDSKESHAVPANVIAFPGLPVIIPFPGLPSAGPRDAASSEHSNGPGHSSVISFPSAEAEPAVEIDVAWPGWARKSDPSAPGNIERVDFNGSTSKQVIVPVAFRAQAAPAAAEPAALSDLPGAGQTGEKSAPSSWAGMLGSVVGEDAQPRLAVGLGAATGLSAEALDPMGQTAGIPAAPYVSDMATLHETDGNTFMEGHPQALQDLEGGPMAQKTEDGRGPDLSPGSSNATDWQMGRPVGLPDRPAPVSSQDALATVERLSELVLRETTLVRQHASGVMTVLLRPDAETELFVHFRQKNGQIQAAVRCERGDFQQLNALWPRLQESLAQRKVNLGALQEPSAQRETHPLPGSGVDAGRSGQGHDRSPWREREALGLEEPRRAEEPIGASESTPPRGGRETGRPSALGRPGWETWA